MSVQTELTRISTAKTNIKNVVNNNTANIITNQKLDAFPPLINDTIVAQKGYIPWIKGEGNNFILKNSKSGELDEFEIYGNTEQTTYSGKNLLSYTLDILKTINIQGTWINNVYSYNGVDYTINEDLTIKVNGTASGASYLIINNDLSLTSGIDYKLNGCPTGGGVSTYAIRLYTGNNYVSQTGLDFPFTYESQNLVRINVFSGTNVNNLVFKPMVRLASITNYTYEPYVGGTASPNPNYPQEIKVVEGNNIIKNVGKNQYGITSVESHNYSNGLPASQNNYMVIDNYDLNNIQFHATTNSYLIALLPTYQLKPNTDYIITYKRTNNLISGSYARRYIYSVDDNNNYSLINVLNSGDNGDMSYQFTTGETGKVAIAFGFNNNSNGSSSTVNNLMVRLATEDDTYQPYQEQTYPIALHGKNFCSSTELQSAANIRFYIDKKIEKTITISFTINESLNNNSLYLSATDALATKITADANTKATATFTLSDEQYDAIQSATNPYFLLYKSGANFIAPTDAQIENNSIATTYEPYYNYELCKIDNYKDEIKKSTGKNLFKPFNYTRTNYGINFTYSEDGSININGTSTGNALSMFSNEASPYLITLQPGTYTISGDITDIRLNVVDNSGALISVTNTNRTFTINETTSAFIRANILSGKTFNNVKIYPQLEENDQATEYEPTGKVWYKHCKVGKYVYNNNLSQNGINADQVNFVTPVLNIEASISALVLSNKTFCNMLQTMPVNGTGLSGSTAQKRIKVNTKGYGTTYDEVRPMFANNNLTIYYVFENPEYEIITNETLINQLNAIETFEGINNISIENENNVLPDMLMITKNKDSYNNWKTKEGLN